MVPGKNIKPRKAGQLGNSGVPGHSKTKNMTSGQTGHPNISAAQSQSRPHIRSHVNANIRSHTNVVMCNHILHAPQAQWGAFVLAGGSGVQDRLGRKVLADTPPWKGLPGFSRRPVLLFLKLFCEFM